MIEELQKLTPEQRRQLADEIGLTSMVAKWRAEDVLKDAKRRYESASSLLNSEQIKFAQVEDAEHQRLNARLANFRKGLDAAELNHVEALGALNAAEQSLADIDAQARA